ncbi:MAG TPA: Lrp/AsnC family transcriptional regulator [Phytomonospora sp.]
MPSVSPIDSLDARLIRLLADEPRIGILECARRLNVARGVIQGYGPDIDAAALGYRVTAFVTLEIRQAGGHDRVGRHLAGIPEVLEAHTVTGGGDIVARVVARDNADLQRVLDQIVGYEGVLRASSVIALAEQVRYRTLPLVEAAGG